jgi:opine dehydrogenase
MVLDRPQPSFSGYWHYPSLELRRRITGSRWVCLLKVTYFLPLANMREFYTDICFGNPEEPAGLLRLARCRDIEPRFDRHIATVRSGDRAAQASMLHPDDQWGSALFTYYYRIVREGQTLTVQWSADGHAYTTALVFNMGLQMSRSEQWLAIRGTPWFTPSDSFADYIILAPPGGAAESVNSLLEHACAEAAIKTGQSVPASGHARLARLARLVQETEQVTRHLLEEEFKASFVTSRVWVYEEVVSTLFELHQRQPGHGYQREAFRYAARAKARAFLLLLAEGHVRVREGSSPVLLAREQELMEQVASVEARLARSTVTEADKRQLARDLSSAITALGKLRTEIMQENARYAQLSYPEPLPTDSIQNDLRDGQIVVLHPGRTLGAIEFNKVLCDQGCKAEVTVAEAGTFIYASRSDGPAQARVFRIKDAVPLAALPATRTAQVLAALAPVYPQFIDGINVLRTGLDNMGAIFHPALTLLNAGRIESTHGDYEFYIEGVTPSVARVLEALDRERVTVAASLGIRAQTAQEWLKMAYDAEGEDLNEAIHNQPGYYGIKAPSTLNHRYIFEDIPMSLVPIAALGQHYGVSVRGMDAIIRLACIIHRTDYWRRGRTLEKLGINRLSVTELTQFVEDGLRCWEE